MLAGAYSSRTECDAASARDHHRPRHDPFPAALRRGHEPVENQRANSAESRAGTRLSRGPRKHRSARLGATGSRHHRATGETATARRQYYFAARRRWRSRANGRSAAADPRLPQDARRFGRLARHAPGHDSRCVDATGRYQRQIAQPFCQRSRLPDFSRGRRISLGLHDCGDGAGGAANAHGHLAGVAFPPDLVGRFCRTDQRDRGGVQ